MLLGFLVWCLNNGMEIFGYDLHNHLPKDKSIKEAAETLGEDFS
jgi:hypothetical protein